MKRVRVGVEIGVFVWLWDCGCGHPFRSGIVFSLQNRLHLTPERSIRNRIGEQFGVWGCDSESKRWIALGISIGFVFWLCGDVRGLIRNRINEQFGVRGCDSESKWWIILGIGSGFVFWFWGDFRAWFGIGSMNNSELGLWFRIEVMNRFRHWKWRCFLNLRSWLLPRFDLESLIANRCSTQIIRVCGEVFVFCFWDLATFRFRIAFRWLQGFDSESSDSGVVFRIGVMNRSRHWIGFVLYLWNSGSCHPILNRFSIQITRVNQCSAHSFEVVILNHECDRGERVCRSDSESPFQSLSDSKSCLGSWGNCPPIQKPNFGGDSMAKLWRFGSDYG